MEDTVEKRELVALLPHFTELAIRKVSAYLLMVGSIIIIIIIVIIMFCCSDDDYGITLVIISKLECNILYKYNFTLLCLTVGRHVF